MTQKLDCPKRCEIPAGYELKEVPPTDKAFSDVLRCPNVEVCDKTLLVTKVPD